LVAAFLVCFHRLASEFKSNTMHFSYLLSFFVVPVLALDRSIPEYEQEQDIAILNPPMIRAPGVGVGDRDVQVHDDSMLTPSMTDAEFSSGVGDGREECGYGWTTYANLGCGVCDHNGGRKINVNYYRVCVCDCCMPSKANKAAHDDQNSAFLRGYSKGML
jgi:hypothetical protein